MKRRTILKAAPLFPLAVATGSAANAESHEGKTAFVLVHGSWHGAWCWGLIEPLLQAAGHMTVAIDLPGHGLNARNPSAFAKRPLDPAAFASEPSSLANIPIGEYAAAVADAAARARAAGAQRVVAVGHSMGGVPVTFAAAQSPELFNDIIYLAALAPTPGKPAGAYLAGEDQATNSKIGNVVLADPATVGALRMDPRSEDAAYLAGAKEALAGDVDDALLMQVMHMLTPDAPVAIYGDVAEFAPGFAGLNRTYIRCTQDMTVVASTPDAIVADFNAAYPDSPTTLVDIDTSHEAMFGAPQALSDALIAAL
ncbi:MAG: alpha/beta fold hydrolase [Pseudomonadota bacterium]